MAHIKTFEEFNKPPVIDEARTVNNVSVANPQNKEELKRWNVVIRSGEAGTISAADSLTEILRQLAQDADFKKWFNSYGETEKNGLTFPNHNLLAIIYLGVQNKTNLIGQTVFKAQVAFLKYATAQIEGSGGFWVGYDVTKTKSRAKVKVDGVDVELAAWDESDLLKLRVTNVSQRIQALDKKTGEPISMEKVNPAYVEEHGAPDGVKPAATGATATGATGTGGTGTGGTATGGTATGGTATGGTATGGTGTGGTGTGGTATGGTGGTGVGGTGTANTSGVVNAATITGLAQGNKENQAVQDLQIKIIALGGPAAADIIAAGGADGSYGSATAKAIGKLILGDPNSIVEIAQINASTAAELEKQLAAVPADAIKTVKDKARVLKPAKPAVTGGTNKQTGGGGVQTKKGKLKF